MLFYHLTLYVCDMYAYMGFKTKINDVYFYVDIIKRKKISQDQNYRLLNSDVPAFL